VRLIEAWVRLIAAMLIALFGTALPAIGQT
jgi:hypothetical protein